MLVTNKSYEEINPDKPKSIIYCDPPYENTGKYQESRFKKEEFLEWLDGLNIPVFISEYTMPERYKLVHSISMRSTLSATNNNKEVQENLYWNGMKYE